MTKNRNEIVAEFLTHSDFQIVLEGIHLAKTLNLIEIIYEDETKEILLPRRKTKIYYLFKFRCVENFYDIIKYLHQRNHILFHFKDEHSEIEIRYTIQVS